MTGKSDVIRVITGEAFKLSRQRKTVLLPLFVAGFAAAIFFGLEMATRRDWIGIPGGYYLAASTIGWIGHVTVLLSVVLTSFFISREFALGTVKSAWTRPIKREAWFNGKIFTACSAVSALFLFAVAVTVALALWRLGFTDLSEKNYVIHTSRDLAIRLALTVGLLLWSIWAATVVMSAVAAVFGFPGGAIACSFWLGLAMVILAMYQPVRPFLLLTYFGLPADQMIAMSKGLPLPMEWNDVVWRTLLGAGAWMVVAYFVGRRVIKRKEITS